MPNKLSIVIPTYTIDKRLEDLALRAVKSYRTYADELIIAEDGGYFSPQLMALSDIYLYSHKNGGFSINVNRGWRVASGEYVAIVSSDTFLLEGNVRELCIEGKVTSPEIRNQNIERLAGPFFVIPQEVTKKRGYLLEEMRTYCSDSEYDHRVKDIFEKVPEVIIWHDQAQTVTLAGVEGGEEALRDRAIYNRLKSQGKAAG